jgi:predicted nucleotidyltransferase
MSDPVAALPTDLSPAAACTLRAVLELVELFLPDGGASAVYLYGSHVYGTAGPRSDLDVLVLVRPGVPAGPVLRLRRALEILGAAALVWADVTVAYEEVLRRDGAVWLRQAARLVAGTDVAAEFPTLTVPEYARQKLHLGAWFVARFHSGTGSARFSLSPPNPSDPWGGYVRPVRGPDGDVRPGTAQLATAVSAAAHGLVLDAGGFYLVGKGATTARAYREHVGDEWSDFLTELSRRCREEWGYLVPESDADRAALRTLCERARGFFAHFLRRYRAFLLEELREGMPARPLAARRLAGFPPDEEIRAALARANLRTARRRVPVPADVLAAAAAMSRPGAAAPATGAPSPLARVTQECILETLRTRFGAIPHGSATSVSSVADPARLRELVRLAASCPDLATFATALVGR